MKAVILENFGDEKNLKYVEDFPIPDAREDEVLVRVKAVALNHLDVWVRMGALAVKPELPHILGSDVSGVVERVGSLVKNVKVGEEVVVAPGLSLQRLRYTWAKKQGWLCGVCKGARKECPAKAEKFEL